MKKLLWTIQLNDASGMGEEIPGLVRVEIFKENLPLHDVKAKKNILPVDIT